MHLSKAGQVISSLALVHVATKHLDRLNILRKGPKLPRLITIASEVPTIIKDYNCSSWLNGKWPRKRRESKIWLIIAHSLDNFIRSELPAWKGDMAKVEIGKRRKMWRNWEPFYTTCKCSDINKQEYDQTGTSNPNMQKYMMLYEFGSSSNQALQTWHGLLILFVIAWAGFSPNCLRSSDFSVYV